MRVVRDGEIALPLGRRLSQALRSFATFGTHLDLLGRVFTHLSGILKRQ